jgi:uncharacterized protein (DUF362 family)
MKRSRKLRASPAEITRREFAAQAGLGLAGLALNLSIGTAQDESRSSLSLVKNPDRQTAIATAVNLLGRFDFGRKDLYLKANYNSADPFPATTHPDTLRVVVALLRQRNCGKIMLVERSGMGSTREIWEKLGIPALARQLDLQLMALDDLSAEEWRKAELQDSNWKNGVEVPSFLNRDSFLIQICNLKTHRFGAVFSASLKNSVGLVAKYGYSNAGHNYMKELHASSQQGAMIAELNLVYEPKLIIMDALQVFTNGGPETGELSSPEVILAGSDRVAIDAVGVALLRLQGTSPGNPLSWRTVYEQEQIKRAIDLRLGASNSSRIHFLTPDARGSRLASQLESILQETPKAKQ